MQKSIKIEINQLKEMLLWNIVTKLCINNSSLSDENGTLLTYSEKNIFIVATPELESLSPLKQHQNEKIQRHFIT